MAELSTEQMEQPAKRWEVASLTDQVKAQNDLIKAMSTKLDVLIQQPHITEAQIKEWIGNEVGKVYAKYDPVYSGVKWLAGVLVVAVVGQIVNIWFQVTGSK